MKHLKILIIATVLISSAGCKKYLDVNNNPNGPSTADPALYLPSIQNGMALGIQFDARLIGPYTQNFLRAEANQTYNLHGYVRNSDFGAELWRNVYWKMGQNMLDLLRIAREQKRWDLVGAGLAMQAWGWQNLTDYHGEIILSEAFDPAKSVFNYDTQEFVYNEVKRLCNEAIVELNKTGDGVGSVLFNRFDMIYKGDRLKWLKFAYAILAINEHHLMKKTGLYNADSVIYYVNNSFASNADDAIVPYLGTSSADANFFGPIRQNLHFYGQSEFIVGLMDGTVMGVPDPRRLIMLSPSGDGVYRGLDVMAGQSTTVSGTPAGVPNLYGTRLSATPPAGTVGRYLYQDKAGFPLMTYAMLQFIKAEAAFLKNDPATALTAYTAGVNAHMTFVQTGMTGPGATPTGAPFSFGTHPSFAAEKTAYLASPTVIPTTASELTLSNILLQKYIALWGYGFIETWTDLRKYDYDASVFTSFQLPTTFYIDNNGKPAYRVRPRYNSEYIWNIDALTAIGGFEPDFHTKKMWIQMP